MTNLRILVLPLMFAAASCALDAPDESVADQALTTKGPACAVGHDVNATEVVDSFTVESYTRSANTIDNTCECAGWQYDMNLNGEAAADAEYPNCRNETFVDVSWQVGAPILAYEISVPTWTASSDAQCTESTLAWELWKETSPGEWQLQSSHTQHMTVGSGRACSAVVLGGPPTDDGAQYRIHALATKGLPSDNSGYAGVVIESYAENE